MFYVKEITTPANSTKSTTVKVWAGVITRVSVYFPPGPGGTLQVRLYHGGHQFSPANRDGYYSSDNETIDYQEYLKLAPGWNEIVIHTKNTSTLHPHMCRVRINVLPIFLAVPYYMMQGISANLRRLLSRIGVT